ncbi:MAG: tetratricopeptide repeat protein [Flammeovirgaceae bacterium]|nr:tetratricopeptide repeat protein [Flammeovirgaceae bacterium]
MPDTTNYELEEKFLQADRFINENRLKEAATLLEEILAEAPDFGKAHNHMGWLYETKFKNYAKAEEHYRLALKFSPEYPAAYYNSAYLLSALRRFDDLEKLLTDAIKVPGINYATIYNEYALLREMQGKLDDAIHYYKLYIQNSYDSKSIDNAAEAINRCERKKQLL